MSTARELADRNPTSPLGNVPLRAVREPLLASARARFAVAILLSLALWAGYFWVVGYPSAS